MKISFVKFLIPVFALFALAGCEVTTEDADQASEIAGTYSVSTYVTQTGPSTGDLSNNKLVVTKVDNTHVKIVLDYADTGVTDVEASNSFVEATSTGYSFSQTFSNATLNGTVTGNDMYYELNYTSGDFVKINASK